MGAASGAAETSEESGETQTEVTPATDESNAAVVTAGTAIPVGVFDAFRQRHFEQGILTEFGRDQAFVAFQPSQFFGRFLGEITYSLNDALRGLEGNASYHVMSGDSDTLQNYYLGLEGGLGQIAKDLDGIITCCQRKVR